MSAGASLGAVHRSGVSDDPAPVVFIDGVPEPRLAVERYAVDGPLDIRSADLSVDSIGSGPGALERWLCSQVSIGLPMRLSDGSASWLILMRGAFKRVEAGEAVGASKRWFGLVDAWDDLLSRPTQSIWWRNPNGTLVQRDSGLLAIGPDANRSQLTYPINGNNVHVIQPGSGLSWTVADALASLSAWSGLGLELRGLPREVTDADLAASIDLAKPKKLALQGILEAYGLVVQRDLMRAGGSVTERRVVRPCATGRPIKIVWADGKHPIGDALKLGSDQPAKAARQWIARADGWRVESSFVLVGGWDPALQGQPDDEYDKALSSDFTTFADVYRRWVLNEDGLFSGPPYNRGPAFDLTAFFGHGTIGPRPLVFQSNLTLNDSGTPMKPVIEISTNSGAGWSIFSGARRVLDDRAGVYLDTTKLPAAFLAAAKAGTARVRVTATLVSPIPVELKRWHGNAQPGTLPANVVDVSSAFGFRRVDPQSVHHPFIQTGFYQADEADDSGRMLRWLVDKMARLAALAPSDGRASLQVAGTLPLLRPGDHLFDVGGPGVTADKRSQAMSSVGAAVLSYETRYGLNTRNGRTTLIQLAY